MVEILADLFTKAKDGEIDKICYLIQGRVAPLFQAIEFGIADKMMIRAIAQAYGVTGGKVLAAFGRLGDLGVTAEQLKMNLPAGGEKRQLKIEKELTIVEAYETLYKIATASGKGSQEEKISLLAKLLREADSLSVRYLVRIPLGKLRLGFSDMTVLDALSFLVAGNKSQRLEIEKAYNVRPDLGFIAKTIKEKGIRGLKDISPKPGTPILMAKAERLSSGEEIIAKIGKCVIEGKIDGLRIQCHFVKGTPSLVRLFSRNLEDVTFMYPDLVRGIIKQVRAREAIFEGEAIAFNPQTGEYLPFQETVQRKRKYDIGEMTKTVPLKLIAFDCLYVDGKNLIPESFLKRREYLEKIIK